jgi:tRNA nucleotidyltransferase/poly(A) polymerase
MAFTPPEYGMAELDPQTQRAFAVEVVEKLRAAGFEALWAGGCVRDQLLGRTPKDYDVATSARPEQIRELFGKRNTLAIGAAFGVISVLGRPRSAGQIEVATFREDAAYSDGRRPDAVTFSTAEADATRRDFTVNGLFFDPIEGRVIDYVGGQEDLRKQVLRAIGNPADRIAEDKLRMLRAIRFAATFAFALEPRTQAAIQAMAGEVKIVSAERIAAELRLMLSHPSRARGVALLEESGLAAAILPEVSMAPAYVWQSTLQQLELLEPFDLQSSGGLANHAELRRSVSFPLAFATLLHAFVDAGAAAPICSRLKLSNKETESIVWLLRNQNALVDAATQPWPRLQRLLIHPGITELLAMHRATHPTKTAEVAFCLEKLALPPAVLNPPPLITGDDLRAIGIPPGPHYQQLLEAVRDAQLDEKLENTSEALRLASGLWRKS